MYHIHNVQIWLGYHAHVTTLNLGYHTQCQAEPSQPLSQWSICCRSRKCIGCLIPVHAIFAIFIYFFIPVLSRSCSTSRTLDKDQKIEQLFYFLLVQVPKPGDIHEHCSEHFVHAIRKRLKKCLEQKVARFGSPGWIPIFQPPLDSS